MFLEKVAKLVLAGFGSGISEEQLSSCRDSPDMRKVVAQEGQDLQGLASTVLTRLPSSASSLPTLALTALTLSAN
jgi:hypothetical protein